MATLKEMAGYMNAMSILDWWYDDGLLEEKDYLLAESCLAKKYNIESVSILRPYDLINSPFRVMYECDGES